MKNKKNKFKKLGKGQSNVNVTLKKPHNEIFSYLRFSLVFLRNLGKYRGCIFYEFSYLYSVA